MTDNMSSQFRYLCQTTVIQPRERMELCYLLRGASSDLQTFENPIVVDRNAQSAIVVLRCAYDWRYTHISRLAEVTAQESNHEGGREAVRRDNKQPGGRIVVVI